MEMNNLFMPSLQHLTLAKIAVMLCNNHDIKAILEKNRRCDSYKSDCAPSVALDGNYLSMLDRSRYPKYTLNYPSPHRDVSAAVLQQIRNKVCSMISPLNLAPSFEKKILNFISHIILEIEKWEEDHSEILPENFDAQVYFCWKSVGTIHRESTAENLFNHRKLNVAARFSLACWYCMQSHLSSLWDNIYDSYKAHLISKCHSGSLLNYWTTHLDGLHFKRSVFPDALYITNLSALHYFYNKCDSKDKKKAFLNDVLSKQWKNLDLVQFCVGELCQNGYEQLSSFQCRNILRCFLNWPLQSLFLDMSEHLLINVDQFGIHDLLNDILKFIIKHHFEDIDYLNLLKEFWNRVPSYHKDSLMNSPEFQPIKIALQQTSAKSLTPEWFKQH
ncbi:uncharacterized protein LOC129957178 [Argiope bruennichi]|uniref:uncharacterized protein LOC129957178 n=1 Tax=Argiope bruennichi TaxID=94029 RepID=UPI002495A07E|nr:uncharacterized protein LOC129957178 [Argiope bruennichi]